MCKIEKLTVKTPRGKFYIDPLPIAKMRAERMARGVFRLKADIPKDLAPLIYKAMRDGPELCDFLFNHIHYDNVLPMMTKKDGSPVTSADITDDEYWSSEIDFFSEDKHERD